MERRTRELIRWGLLLPQVCLGLFGLQNWRVGAAWLSRMLPGVWRSAAGDRLRACCHARVQAAVRAGPSVGGGRECRVHGCETPSWTRPCCGAAGVCSRMWRVLCSLRSRGGLDQQEHQRLAHPATTGSTRHKEAWGQRRGCSGKGPEAVQWISWRQLMSAVVDVGRGPLVRWDSRGWSGIGVFCPGLGRRPSALLRVPSSPVLKPYLGKMRERETGTSEARSPTSPCNPHASTPGLTGSGQKHCLRIGLDPG